MHEEEDFPTLVYPDIYATSNPTPDPTPGSLPPALKFPPSLIPEIFGGVDGDDGYLPILIGGIVGGVLLLVICSAAVLLWCLSRHKGSYVTNETDEYDDYDDEFEESVGSDAALQPAAPSRFE